MDSKCISVVFNLIFLLLIIIVGINLLLNVDLTKSINLNGETNDFCQKLNKSTITDNSLEYLVCNNKFKKNKIILLFIDSLPFDNLHELIDFNKTNITNFFRGKGLEYKQSGALFETILTGKFSRNYLANTTEFDSLPKQFKNANMNVFYKIRNFPLGTLIKKDLMNKIEMHSGESIPLFKFCENNNLSFYQSYSDTLFEEFLDKISLNYKKGLNKDMLYKKVHKELDNKIKYMHDNFNGCFMQNNFDSMVFFTDCLDHNIHVLDKYNPVVTFNIFFAEEVIKEIIKWINEEHGEYALAVASDHGGQTYNGEDAICNHGCNHPGNEAFLFVYTKELGENYIKYKMNNNNDNIPLISLNDFPCVIAQSLINVNLPLESTCTPRYIGNDSIIKYSSIKSKEIQLKKYIEKLCNKYPELNKTYNDKYYNKLYKHKFNDYFKDIESIYKAEDKIFDEYIEYLMNIQNDLLNDVIISSHNRIYYI